MTTRARDESSHAAAGITVSSIVEAGLAVVAERGVTGLTMAAVADRLKVRSPSLYHHIRNKADLLNLLARDAFVSFNAERDAYHQAASVDEWIRLTTSGTLRLRDFYASHPGLAALVQATATADRDQDRQSRGELTRAQIRALIRLGVPEREAKETFEACSRWTMAAVAAEGAGGRRRHPDDDLLFRRGLDWLMAGVRVDLERRTAPT